MKKSQIKYKKKKPETLDKTDRVKKRLDRTL